MPKKFKLSIQQETEFNLAGISTTLRDYKLAYSINQHLNADFKRIIDFQFIPDQMSETIDFSMFQYHLPDSSSSICLLQNRHIDGFLIPAFRQADYFFITSNLPGKIGITDYISELRKVPNILTAFMLETVQLKNADIFFEELELHLMNVAHL